MFLYDFHSDKCEEEFFCTSVRDIWPISFVSLLMYVRGSFFLLSPMCKHLSLSLSLCLESEWNLSDQTFSFFFVLKKTEKIDDGMLTAIIFFSNACSVSAFRLFSFDRHSSLRNYLTRLILRNKEKKKKKIKNKRLTYITNF